MRTLPTLLSICAWVVAQGQLEVDRAIQVSGTSEQKRVLGLSAPTYGSSAITVEVASSGIVHWATAQLHADTITLTPQPTTSYRQGLLLRFLSTMDNMGDVWIRLPGLAVNRLVRPDGAALPYSTLRDGRVAEVLFNGNDWILLSASSSTCPVGSIAVNARLCMDVDATPSLRFYEAVDVCGTRGGKLCTWDEYAAGCILLQDQLNGLFDEWEWIDDTSNHTHTANQVARFTCQGQRSANVITTMVGDTRWCYHPR